MKAIVIGSGFGAQIMAPGFNRVGISTKVISPRDQDAVSRAIAAGGDLVSIHSPPFLHLEHVTMALERGLPVLCDKPFGLNAREARLMRDRALEIGIPHFVNFELRWKPGRRKTKELLDAGAIGTLQHVSWTMFGDGLRRQPHGWLFEAERRGGWIGAYGAHAIDALRWLTGSEVIQAGGMARIEIASRPDRNGITRPSTAEDAFTAWLQLADGTTASLDTAYCTAVPMEERILLLGDKGSIELVDDQALTLRRPGASSEHFTFVAPPGAGYAPSLDPWLTEVRDAIREGRRIAPDFDDGVANTEALDLLHASVIRVGPR